MTAKLPHCAYCGEPLSGARARVVETLPHLPGGPSFGWHMAAPDGIGVADLSCFARDRVPEVTGSWLRRTCQSQQALVHMIAERGLRRVVFTRKVK